MSGMTVIARNTAFTYKGKSVDVAQVGQDLNTRYALEGSVQRRGDRMRVNVQLIDAGTGNHLWAERFDKPVGDLFDMQDEIVTRLARQLGTELIGAEARRAERAPNPDSVDLYFQGMASLNKGNTPDYLLQARDYFERALKLDPYNVEALVWGAYVDTLKASLYAGDDRTERLAEAEAALTMALSLAPEHAWAHLSPGPGLDPDQTRVAGHRAMRAGAGDRPQSCSRSRHDRPGKISYRQQRRDRGPCRGSATPQPARFIRRRVDVDRR